MIPANQVPEPFGLTEDDRKLIVEMSDVFMRQTGVQRISGVLKLLQTIQAPMPVEAPTEGPDGETEDE